MAFSMQVVNVRMNHMPETSIIIRTRNEARWLGEVLMKLEDQDYKDFEVVIVDSGSTDRTLEIAKKFHAKVVQIPPGEFSYPRALNVGAENSAATKYLLIMSGHSLPNSNKMLSGSLKNFRDPKVAGVYGYVRPLFNATLADKFFYVAWIPPLAFFHPRLTIRKPGMGVLGFTNAIIRKELWEQHHFDESYGLGGEDGEWAGYWLARGYYIVKDWACTVRHSHNLDWSGWEKQWRYWYSLGKPHPFHSLDFRKDGAHLPDHTL
jgi:rhamnosyltransferase